MSTLNCPKCLNSDSCYECDYDCGTFFCMTCIIHYYMDINNNIVQEHNINCQAHEINDLIDLTIDD
jgi:hypothetical protein